MFGLEILDVAIGVVFLYLIMSLIASAVMELIEALLQYRGRDLLRGIGELISDSAVVNQLYSHPLISGLYRGNFASVTTAGRLAKRRLPSYIPAKNFSLALLDVLGIPVNATTAAPPPAAGTINPTPPAPPPINLPALPNTAVNKVIANLVKAAANNATKARENIEEWFNAGMDRVSGWYKRRTHWILACLGLIAAAALNVDSITVAQRLATDKNLRDSVVKSAMASNLKPDETKPANVKEAADRVATRLDALDQSSLPIGWKEVPQGWAWLSKIIGLLITASAVTLGAPFWFDVLNKIIVVRSTVKPKEKSGTEGSKEPR